MDANSRPLNEVVVNLLPTPTASRYGRNKSVSAGAGIRPTVEYLVRELDAQWIGSNGKDYGLAVRRWEEITGHPAPCPTEDGTRGNRRLNPEFSEWMMGLEPGRVTDIVAERNDALHVIGNGVVPRQAEAAFRFLMDDENWSGEVDDIEAVELNGPTKTEKPRGECTGCAFDYQLGTARTGEHKGELVIRKHNSRTGPGLCSGAQQPPEPTYEELEGAAKATALIRVPEPDAEHCVPGRCEGCCGCSSVCTTDPCGQPDAYPGDVVGVDPFTAPSAVPNIVYSDTPHEVVQDPASTNGTLVLPTDWDKGPTPRAGAELDFRHMAAPHPQSMTDGIDAEPTPENVMDKVVQGLRESRYIPSPNPIPDLFTAPAPASDIPESTVTVSGQPEPDRDRWSRYLIHGQAHTRATTFAKLGANTKAIEAWNERNVIRGMTLRPDLLMLANGLEVKRDRSDLNSIAAQAKDAAGSKVAANIGTAYHAFSEWIDAGLINLRDVPEQYQGRVHQYTDAITRAGLTTRPEWIERTTAVRADQVGAPLPVAGTLDRIFQLPDGSLVIGDLKTGSDLSYSEMEIEVQLALYAHGVNTHGLFDWNTKTWQRTVEDPLGRWPLEVRTDIAIVVHLPADGDGCTLYVADIERGWRDAQRLGPLQASLKEKNRFRTLTAADLAPRPVQPSPEQADADDAWERAKLMFSTAPDQATVAQLYQYAMDSGKFHQDQLAVLVGLGMDRLNALARA